MDGEGDRDELHHDRHHDRERSSQVLVRPATVTSGPGTFIPGQPTAGAAVTLNVVRTAFSRTGSNGNNSATWNPTLIVDVPATAIVGTYQGTVTHSVF